MSISDADIKWQDEHLWHPYSSVTAPIGCYAVESASGCELTLANGRRVIDGMSSWWTAIHGYSNERLIAAGRRQLEKMSHVMFGGLTHEPAIELGRKLLAMVPANLQRAFFCDSGSVSVEVAIKMALQYQLSCGQAGKTKLLALRGAYHGDTFGAMSLCDPTQGMHSMWRGRLAENIFADRPELAFGAPWHDDFARSLRDVVRRHHSELAAVIIEPIVQGAGGMWFYHSEYVKILRELCDEFGLLLIADEIATGFGRTGRLWGCDHAGIAPDIMCVGKALTGGMLSLAATCCSDAVAERICRDGGVLMHGPTFMANPLACAIAAESLAMIDEMDIPGVIGNIQLRLADGLDDCRDYPGVVDVRVLGAIGVVEFDSAINIEAVQRQLLADGVWLRPFGRLLYTMPPYAVSDEQLAAICWAIKNVLEKNSALES